MKSHFEKDPIFWNVHVKGEVSGKFISGVGNLYFTLKDKRSEVHCIVYKRNRKNILFDIENGMKLLVIADVVVYPPHGKYQLSVKSATEDGLGQLFVRYQQLKKKLEKEGLFDNEHKKELPRFVKRIGVITSEGGSVIHDILKTVKENWPYCNVFLFPAAVQGAKSKGDLVRQIGRADNSNLDVLIVARGGGSLQDLWSYNEEIVARAIFNAKTPVISAIGHEDDTTLADLVADRRASTPTMAASMAVEDKNIIIENINHYNSRLITFVSSKIDDYKKQMEFMLSKSLFADKTYVYKSKWDDFDELRSRFDSSSMELIKSNRVMLNKIVSEYVIRHPCKMQLDVSRSNLNELKTRLIDAMQKTLNDNGVNLDKATNEFKFLSEKYMTSRVHDFEKLNSALMANPYQKHIDASKNTLDMIEDKLIGQINLNIKNNENNLRLLENNFNNYSKDLINSKKAMLNNVSSEYVIRNPCKMQIDNINANLEIFQNSLNDSLKRILTDCRDNLEETTKKFNFESEMLITSKRHDFEIAKSNFSLNLCQNKIDSSRDAMNLAEEKIISQININVENNRNEFVLLKNKFNSNSNELILRNSHKLDSIKNSRIIKNPYLMLDSHRNELDIYKEKLDKINQTLMLKKEQQKQKQKFMLIIVVIVALMIIMLFIMFGGIL